MTCLPRRVGAGLLQGLVAAVVGVLALAAPASAQLPSGPGPLQGSSFQGGDGDHDAVPTATPPLHDWESLQASGPLQHNPDRTPAANSEFAGGTDELRPGYWQFVNEGEGGVSPGQSDIKDGWSAVTQAGGNTFLYLGFTRRVGTGTNQINVELNHDPQPWENLRGAEVPCRRDGDLMIGFLPQGNDPAVTVRLYRWRTTNAATSGRPCALTGTWTQYANLPAGSAQGTMNPGSITNRLQDGFYNVGATMNERTFGEAALNLTRLLEEVLDDPCVSFGLISMHSHSSGEITSALKDWVKPGALTVRTCSASGTKFFDRNANGRRDRREPPLANFRIWADYEPFDGEWDPDVEPSAITDAQGEYVINDIRPPVVDGRREYMLRETLLPSARLQRFISNEWRCSVPRTTGPGGRFPCAHGPIDVDEIPYAQGRDFGNWLPASITVEKKHYPQENPGQFQLLVNNQVVLNFPEEGSSQTVFVRPGRYRVSERPVPPTDLSQYARTEVDCQTTDSDLGRRREGTVFENLRLLAGQNATCTFRNVRLGPAIGITKSARPLIVEAGDTITYTLKVTNPGRVSFEARDVQVTDSRCDDAPALVRQQHGPGPDNSPRTLDQDDVWIYRCTHKTPAAGEDCQAHRIRNTARVVGTANEQTARDFDRARVTVLCPDQPVPPGPDPPGPEPPPGPRPPAPRPPDADAAGQAGVLFRRAITGCIATRVPRINFTGTKVARIAVFVNGRPRRNLTVQTLQRRVTPRVTVPPGRRYRLAVRVNFQRGSGTPPVTLRGAFRTCPARPPAVTG